MSNIEHKKSVYSRKEKIILIQKYIRGFLRKKILDEEVNKIIAKRIFFNERSPHKQSALAACLRQTARAYRENALRLKREGFGIKVWGRQLREPCLRHRPHTS